MNQLKLTNTELGVLYMALRLRARSLDVEGASDHDKTLAEHASQLSDVLASNQKRGCTAVVTFEGGTANGNVRVVQE
jgi:hypothetical protein